MKALPFFLLLFFSAGAIAQPEPAMLSIKGIGGDQFDQTVPWVTKMPDGGFVVAIATSSDPATGNIGSFCGLNGYRSVFTKYNADFSISEWSKCYQANGDSGLIHFFSGSGGEIVLGGGFTSTAGWGWLIARHDAAGNVLWQHNYSKGGGAQLRSMIATEDGGYIMMGEAYYTDTNVLVHHGSWMDADLWVLRVDSNGNKVWSNVIGGTYEEAGIALVPAPGDGCYVLGATQSSDYDCSGYHAGGQDAYLARLDKDGNILWHKCLGGSGYEASSYSGCGAADGKGGILMAVSTTSTDGDVHHHINREDYWVLNVDSAGGIVWENCFDGGEYDYPSAICKATDGSVWVNGWKSSANEDVFVVHADSVGTFQSSVTISSSGKDRGQMIYPLTGGSVIAGGYFSKNDGTFSPLNFYSDFLSTDMFLAVFAPWNVGVKDISLTSSIKLYPNPVDKLLHVEINESGTLQSIGIVDVVGRLVLGHELSPGVRNVDIPTEMLAKGVYYVQIVDGNGERFVEKIEIR
jgi:hypothetical protein